MTPSPSAAAAPTPELPAALVAALQTHGVAVTTLRRQERGGRGSVLDIWRSDRAVAVLARDERGRRTNLLEVEGRRYAGRIGVAAPAVWECAGDGSWLLGEWVPADRPRGSDYVHGALALADRIMAAPAPHFSLAPMSWRASARGRVLRTARLVAAGLNPREFLAARGEAAQLPADRTAHGDFYFRNVLATPAGLRVVDWEFAGPAPAFSDHLRFWSTIKSDADRDEALAVILRGRSSAERADIGVLGRWLAFRLFAENVSAPRRWQNPADREHARAGLAFGRELYVRTRP